MSLFWSFTRKA